MTKNDERSEPNGKAVGGFALTAALEGGIEIGTPRPWHPQAVYLRRADQPVIVRVTLHNQTRKPLVYLEEMFEREFRFHVVTERGAAVPHTLYGKDLYQPIPVPRGFNVQTQTLSPGDPLVFRFSLSRLFDLSVSGEYRVTVGHLFPVHQPGPDSLKLPLSPQDPYVRYQSRIYGPYPTESEAGSGEEALSNTLRLQMSAMPLIVYESEKDTP